MGLPNRSITNVAQAVSNAIADQVWDEVRSGHSTTGSYGAAVVPEAVIKTLTFTGAAGLGAVGNVPLFTVTGTVEILRITPRCTTGLGVNAGATLALGIAGDTARFIAATLAVSIVAGKFWYDAVTVVYDNLPIPDVLKEVTIESNIVGTVAVASVTSGVIEFEVVWRPRSAGATLVAA